MRLKGLTLGLAAAVAATGIAAPALQAADTQYFPLFTYRTGPYAPNGIPSANGIADYMNYVNLKHGGVNGVKLVWEECEFGYNTKKGVECYERLKGKGATIVFPYSTGLTYKLIPNAEKDKVVILSVGYGNTSASDGRVFPWTFTTPTTYWSQASAFIKYIGAQEGGMDKLKGKKIALIYHNSAYGKEPIRTLNLLARKLGYKLTLLAVNHPGQEQKATWLQIRRDRPDWVLLWGWGVMNQVAIKEATNIGFKMDRMIGVWWSGAEQDVVPTGDAAKGYKAGTFHAAGGDFPLIKDIKKVVYDAGKGIKGGDKYVGQVLWNRGMVNAIFATEVRRQGSQRRPDALGYGKPQHHRRTLGGAGPERLHAAGQEHLRRPRRQRPGADSAVGRQEVEYRQRLHHADARGDPSADREIRSRLRQEKQHHTAQMLGQLQAFSRL